MFKTLKINAILVIAILVSLSFFSCDGRYRRLQTNSEIFAESDFKSDLKKQIHFVPKQPVIIETDTILANGFNVKINYHSLNDDYSQSKTAYPNDKDKTTYYSNFEAAISVYKNNEYCNEFILNKSFFHDFESPLFLEKAIMQYVWVDFTSSTNQTLRLNTTFNIPDTEIYKDFIIEISNLGAINIRRNNFSANTI